VADATLGRYAGFLRFGFVAESHRTPAAALPPIFGRILLWNALADGRRATFYYARRWPKLFRETLSTALLLLAEGKIQARIARRMPPERAAEALGLLASGKVTGKVVLVPVLPAGGDQMGAPSREAPTPANRCPWSGRVAEEGHRDSGPAGGGTTLAAQASEWLARAVREYERAAGRCKVPSRLGTREVQHHDEATGSLPM
jgi:Zinc-binding dehydrogenase